METNKNNPGKIEKSILSQNKIPGCDQLTRPEEIKALSKYLGNIRKVQEKHTTLQKDNLEVPGRTTGRIPKVELPDFIDPLSESKNKNKAKIYGESSRVPLEKNHDPKELNKSAIGLEDSRKTELGETRIGLNGVKEAEIKNHREPLEKKPEESTLGKTRIDLEDARETNLSGYRENLEDTRETTLKNYREPLEDLRETKLGKTKIGLEVGDNTSLENYREKLEDTRETNLSEYRENLEDTRETTLKNYREPLEDPREINLNGTKEKLNPGEGIDSLEGTKEKLDFGNNIRTESLGNIKEKLDFGDNIGVESLGNVKERLDFGENFETESLGNTKEQLDFGDNLEIDSLGNTKEELNFGNNLSGPESLGNYREPLEDPRETTISDYREQLNYGNNLGPVSGVEDYREPLDFGNNLEPVSEVEDYQEPLDYGNNLEPVSEVEDYREPLDYGNNLGPIDRVEDYREPLDYGNNLGPVENLEDTVIPIGDGVPNDIPLEDFVDKLTDNRETEIGDYREPLDYGDNLEPIDKVEDYRDPLNYGENLEPVSGVEDYKEPLDFGDNLDPIEKVEDYREPLDYGNNLESTEELEDFVDELTDDRETELEDFIDKITDDRDTELPDKREELPETSQSSPRQEGDYNYFSPDQSEELYTESIELSPHIDGKRDEGVPNYLDLNSPEDGYLYEESIERPDPDRDIKNYISLEDKETEAELPYSEAIERPGAGQDSPRQEGDYNYIDPSTAEVVSSMSDLTGDELYNKAMEFMKETETAEWEKKIQSLVSSYLSGSVITPEQAEEFEQKLGREIKVAEVLADLPPMKLPSFSLDSLNINNYLRYITEKTVGQIKNRGIRETLIQETLAGLVWARDKLERVSKSDRSRLPGNDMGIVSDLVSGGVSGVLDNLGSRLGDTVTSLMGKSDSANLNNPVNYPKDSTTGWENVNSKRVSQSQLVQKTEEKGESFWKKLGGALKDSFLGGSSNGKETYSFTDNYIKGKGIKTTLEALCYQNSETNDSSTVEGLFNLLQSSPFITTPNKFSSNAYGGYRIQTLDSDAYWEVILEPFVGDENGGLSYLPGLHEINLRNIAQHGVNTGYNKWIPFQGFDLQKNKMTNKTLQLYDGEISYPVSMEFTNEFRITIADDQYKSWRTYFEECAKAAIYNSEGHDESFYTKGKELTAIDTSNVVIAMYKNITFRCRIYIMTPQYSTIHDYDLLLVMKDFSEEHSGSIDGGASDLTVSFSIVGEKPNIKDDSMMYKYSLIQAVEGGKEENSLLNKVKNAAGSIVEHGVNTVIGLIT